MEKKEKKKIGVKFKSSNRKYYIWIGSNGKIAIDRNYRWILEEKKLKNIDEKIFIIMNALKNRDFDIHDIKRRIGSYLYDELNLKKSNALRQKRKSDKFNVRDMISIDGNSISVELNSSNYHRIVNKIMTDTIGLNIKERLLVKTARSIINLLAKNIGVNSGFNSSGFKYLGFPVNIKVSLIPDDDIPSVETDVEYKYVELGHDRFKYPKYSYEINVNRSWYYNIYLKDRYIIENNWRQFIVMKIEDNKSRTNYYIMSNSFGYTINVKKLTLKKWR